MSLTFEFYSDTNLNNAIDELQLMSLEPEREGSNLRITSEDMQAMGDSIEAIIASNGGELIE